MSNSRPSAKRARVSAAEQAAYRPDITGETVDIRVGGTKTFHVHKSVLCTSRTFAQARKLDLPNEKPTTFETYVQWLYSRNIRMTPTQGETVMTHLILAYVLGEVLQDEHFQRTVLTSTIQHCTAKNIFPGDKHMNIIYYNTVPGSPARRFLVDSYVWVASESWVEGRNIWKEFHPQLVNDIITALVTTRAKPGTIHSRPWVLDLDAYLNHIERATGAATGSNATPQSGGLKRERAPTPN